MDRRAFVALAGAALAVPHSLLAQPAKRVFRIAILDDAVESARSHTWQWFRNRLRELVLKDGNDVAYEARYASGDSERLPVLAAELVALKPDVIVCAGTPASSAVLKATSSIPVIFLGSGDPVRAGLVASLARPGGNATGFSTQSPETYLKSLELLHELSPRAKRFGYLTDASSKSSVVTFRRFEESARKMKLSAQMLDGRERAALERSFATIRRERVQGLFVSAAGAVLAHRDQIVQFAAHEKLSVVYGRRDYVDAGGLLSFSADLKIAYVRGADFVHRILQGAKPADLPVEQVSNFVMVLNLKTARALGIAIPQTVRMRADEVIE